MGLRKKGGDWGVEMGAAKSDAMIQFTKVQIYMALAAQSIVILSAALGLALWVGRVLVADEFQTQLDIFHAHAKPEIEQMVDRKLLTLSNGQFVSTAEFRQTTIQRIQALETLSAERSKQLERIEDKLDRLLQAQGHR